MGEQNSSDNVELELKRMQFEAILTEYNNLRGEIDSYHHHQNEIINFMIAIIVGILGLIGIQDVSVRYAEELNIIFMLLPVICMILSCLYTDRTIRIIRIADYLHNCIRPQIDNIVNQNTFQWEIYKRKTKLFNRHITSILDKVRWAVFLAPSITAIVIFANHMVLPISVSQILLVSFSGLCTIAQFIIMFIVEETKGIKDRVIRLED